MIIWRNCLKKRIEKIRRKGFEIKGGNKLRSKKNKLYLLALSPSIPAKKKRYGVSKIKCFNGNKKSPFASNYTKPKN